MLINDTEQTENLFCKEYLIMHKEIVKNRIFASTLDWMFENSTTSFIRQKLFAMWTWGVMRMILLKCK